MVTFSRLPAGAEDCGHDEPLCESYRCVRHGNENWANHIHDFDEDGFCKTTHCDEFISDNEPDFSGGSLGNEDR